MEISKDVLIDLIKENSDLKDELNITEESKMGELGIDSVGFFTLIFSIEETFNIEFDDQTIDALTVNDTIGNFIDKLSKQGITVE